MHSTKADLVTMFRTIDDELGGKIIKDFISSIDWLKQFVSILEAAETRLLSAGAALELEDQQNEGASD